jgi:RimJ/RimL family protein N-acetyltransferase
LFSNAWNFLGVDLPEMFNLSDFYQLVCNMDIRKAKSVLISLHVPQLQDMQFIRQLWSDPETMAPVGGPIHLSEQEALDWFVRMIDPGSSIDCYRLIVDSDGNAVGEVSFHRLDTETMTAELNIKILASKMGFGYATGALYLFLDYFFNNLGGRAVIDNVRKLNVQGQEFLRSFGFEEETASASVRVFKMTEETFRTIASGAPSRGE